MKLACGDVGTGGSTLVLLHGFPLGSGMWVDVAEQLGARARVLIPDLVGHGASPAPAGAYDIAQMADDVAELVAEKHVTTPLVICGLSMGGYVALAFAARHRERLAGLILCDTRAGADTPDAAKGREELAAKVESSGSTQPVIEAFLPKLLATEAYERRPELVARLRTLMAEHPVAGVAGCLRAMARRPSREELLPSLQISTLVLVGADDRITPPDVAHGMVDRLPNASLQIIDGSGHLPPLENPQATTEAILRYIDKWA